MPPPGSYDVAEAFEKLQTGGKMATTIVSGSAKTELFIVKEDLPAPNQYDVAHASKAVSSYLGCNGSFVSTVRDGILNCSGRQT